MIHYKSTRGDPKKYTFSEAVLQGLASDGGLLVPEKIPLLTSGQLEKMQGKTYREIALTIFEAFETDFSRAVLKKITARAYGDGFGSLKIAPVVKLDRQVGLIELWHGPTGAFKDMALRVMPYFFLESLKMHKKKQKYLILAATSGDTGKAALAGYKDLEQISVLVLYPKDKVSKLQELQMTTQAGPNLKVAAVKGDFDGTQKLVKQIFADRQFGKLLAGKFNTRLSSANSINWGRLVPQIIYYFSSYLDLVTKKEIKMGEKANVAVPTGNFGNILAAFLAKKMGLPVGFLICASNSNNSLTGFLKEGVYDTWEKQIKTTLSPAMDILTASNIERLLYFLKSDSQFIIKSIGSLQKTGKFSVDNKTLEDLQETFYAGSVTDNQTLNQIRKSYYQNGYLLDPHTAVAVKVAGDFLKKTGNRDPVLVCSTAHWSKFPETVFKALNLKQTGDEFVKLKLLSGLGPAGPAHKSIGSLEGAQIKHKQTIPPNLASAKNLIIDFLTDVKT